MQSSNQGGPISSIATATFTTATSTLRDTRSNEPLDSSVIRTLMPELDKDAVPLGESSKQLKSRLKPIAKKPESGANKAAKAPRKAAGKAKQDQTDVPGEGEDKPKKPRKPRTKKVVDAEVDSGEQVTAPRKPRAKKSDKDSADGTIKEKPARKPRAKKIENGDQTKLVKGQVTKTTAKTKASLSVKNSEAGVSTNAEAYPFTDDAGFGLAEAVKRRINWTPPASRTKSTTITPMQTENLANWLASGSDASGDGKKGFTDLLKNFGFTKTGESGESAVEQKSPANEVTRKRKLIELVKTNVTVVGAVSPTKERVPKKKARTITAQATAAYMEEAANELPSKPAHLLQYFDLQTTDRPSKDGFKIPPKPRSKSPVKGQSKSKKGSALAPILLSPESALKQARDQDYVFGTSSQLAREDSPTLLRDLHEAMQASNEADDYEDPFSQHLLSSLSESLTQTSQRPLSTKRNLWSAAARDSFGDLVEVEMLDLANSSPTSKKKSATVFATVPLSDGIDNEAWLDIEDTGQPMLVKNKSTETKTEKPLLAEESVVTELFSSPPRSRIIRSPSKIPVVRDPDPDPVQATKLTSTHVPKTSADAMPKMPDFSLYPTTKLEKQIAAYRFKPVKGRPQMIALLERCWEGKNRLALEALATNLPVTAAVSSSKPPPSSQVVTISPKRPRGRPRKDATTNSPPKVKKVSKAKPSSTVEGLDMDSDHPLPQKPTPKKSSDKRKPIPEEIEDSDAPSTPSPPRRQSSKVATAPLPLQLTHHDDASLSPDSLQKLLFTHISRALKSQPPSKNSTLPNWHEKILLYDPIVLEDLTVWLNTVHWKGWAGMVRSSLRRSKSGVRAKVSAAYGKRT
jgi:hypothetical protein